MSWVNLNDIYVNKTGDTVIGDLSVNGTLTANGDLTANGGLTVKKDSTIYNVADEISTLRDSVSQTVNALSSKVFNEMHIEAVRVGNVVTLHVQGEHVLTTPETNIKIAELNCTPSISVRSFIGINNDSWLLLVVNTDDQNVYLRQRYGTSNITWGLVDISCSFIVAA